MFVASTTSLKCLFLSVNFGSAHNVCLKPFNMRRYSSSVVLLMKLRIYERWGTVEPFLCSDADRSRTHHLTMSGLYSWIIMFSSVSVSLLTAAAGWGVTESAALDMDTQRQDNLTLQGEKWESVLTTSFQIVLLDFHFYFMTCGTHNSSITLIVGGGPQNWHESFWPRDLFHSLWVNTYYQAFLFLERAWRSFFSRSAARLLQKKCFVSLRAVRTGNSRALWKP